MGNDLFSARSQRIHELSGKFLRLCDSWAKPVFGGICYVLQEKTILRDAENEDICVLVHRPKKNAHPDLKLSIRPLNDGFNVVGAVRKRLADVVNLLVITQKLVK